ncbi:MAG: isoprenoid biosynthesis glyoxalase ElbB [Deltaproteobacteria bacterium]|jgi:enhancing lycopene biosynthesis protein 2|nr:isoprenoid biosynthesis glyoxalase ElbB [Deltaproteobacteria bacterium]
MADKVQFAVILSGCGNKDGAEIHESVMTLWAIHKHGADYQCFAPDIPQHHVLNFITNQEMEEERNVLVEAARIARGNIKDLAEYRADDFDALVIPGGLGVAKNLSTFAFDGPNCVVNEEVERAIRDTATLGKPIGALCIAPAIIAKILGDVTVTIGRDPGTEAAIAQMGASHSKTTHGEIVVDREKKVVTTPCYMLDARVDQIGDGAENLVKAVLEMA